jgi:hypothetical protein
LTITNPLAIKQWIRFYNKASYPDPSACSANSNCPIASLVIPANGDSLGGGFSLDLGSDGIAFSTGISYAIVGAACTALSTCTDETAAGTDVEILAGYK